MEIIKENIEKVLSEAGYVYKEKYPDSQLNHLYNYWYFLQEYETELAAAKTLEVVIYSKLYWFSRLADRFYEVYGFDAGIEQQQGLILEEMDWKIDHIDWNLVESLCDGEVQ